MLLWPETDEGRDVYLAVGKHNLMDITTVN